MKLVKPNIKFQKSFLEATKETSAAERKILTRHYQETLTSVNFTKYLNALNKALAATYWLIEKKEFIGVVSIRHHLTNKLNAIGGHITYFIRPSRRGQGYGSQILKLALIKAKEMQLKKILLTCNKDNIASHKIIKKNGGKLTQEIDSNKHRFWIEI